MKARLPAYRQCSSGASALPAVAGSRPKLGLTAEHPIPLSRVPHRLRRYLKPVQKPVWLTGEVTNIRPSGNGHLRFALQENGVAIECVAWRSEAIKLRQLFDTQRAGERADPTIIRAGDSVAVLGTLSLDSRRVGIQLAVTDARRHGVAAAEVARERARQALQRDGLMNPTRTRRLPRLPRLIALVTSEGSAAQRDVEAVARSRYPGLPIVVVPAQVQGAGASRSLMEALHRATQLDMCDIVLLCRGGGAAGELGVFNDEALARAIAKCAVPVITGIGHETDVTLADCVADLRAATPTAAAMAAIPIRTELEGEADRRRQQLFAAVSRRLEQGHMQLRHARGSMGQNVALRVEHARRMLDRHQRELLTAPSKQVTRARLQFDRAEAAIHAHLTGALDRSRAARNVVAGQLAALDPAAVLERGYALVLDDAQAVLGSAAAFIPGRLVTLRLHDGDVRVQVVAR